jgi:hypothetical protein
LTGPFLKRISSEGKFNCNCSLSVLSQISQPPNEKIIADISKATWDYFKVSAKKNFYHCIANENFDNIITICK